MCRWSQCLAAVLCLLAAGLDARESNSGAGLPLQISYHELVRDITIAAAPSSAAPAVSARREASFSAFGRRFELDLEPNPLFAEGAKTIWVGAQKQKMEAPEAIFYRGHVKGSDGSWVRVTVRGPCLDGMIFTRDEVYFVEPASRYFPDRSSREMVIYRLSDCESDWVTGSCALDHPEVASRMGSHRGEANPMSNYELFRAALPPIASATYKRCEIGVVADYECYLAKGSGAASYMQGILNQIDGIYKSELGVTLTIAQTVVYTSPGDPFTGSTDPETLLNELSAYRNNASSPVHSTDLAHLFTSRELDSSVIGIAWVGALCSGYYGAGLSQAYTFDNKSLVLLTAHEIGHNFGAWHDNQGGSPCGSVPFGYIMNPYVSTALNLQFSSCSKSYIGTEVSGAGCLDTVTSGGNQMPVANAGTDQTVVNYASVTLNGTGSYDPDGNPISYQWQQIGGTSVALSNALVGMPTFTAPGSDDTLTFRLTVSDGSLSHSDDVTVFVGGSGGSAPVISSVVSSRPRPGSNATIYGSGFSSNRSAVYVLFGNRSARIRSTSPTAIGVRIPPRLSRHRTVMVYVAVEGVWSNGYAFTLN